MAMLIDLWKPSQPFRQKCQGSGFRPFRLKQVTIDGNRLVVAHGIRSVIDLKGKKVAVDKLTSHAGLNIWLFLRQEGLDADRGDVDLVEVRGPAEERWKRVLSGEFAGTFVTLPHDTRAERAGAHVIRVHAMPMIRGVTLTTNHELRENP
jgi:ABC-type nitrate/sulfonate/bicarbonate transport system substrate-binding protein